MFIQTHEMPGRFDQQLGQQREQYQRERAVYEMVYEAISQSQDLDEVLNRTLDATLEATGLEIGAIYLYDQSTGHIQLAAHRGFPAELIRLITEQPEDLQNGVVGQVARSGLPVVEDEPANAPTGERQRALDEGHGTRVHVPLKTGGKVVGVLEVGTRGWNHPTSCLVPLLQGISTQVGTAIEKAQLYTEVCRSSKQIEEQAQRLWMIHRLSTQFNATLDLPHILQLVVDEMAKVVQADQCALILFDNGGETGWVAASHPPLPSAGQGAIPLQDSEAVETIMLTHEPLVLTDASLDPFVLHLRRLLPESDSYAALIVPLTLQERVLGVIQVCKLKQPGDFSRQEIDLCQIIANSSAIAVENARLYQREREAKDLLAALGEISEAGLTSSGIDEMLGELIKRLVRYSGTDAGMILLRWGEQLHVRAVWGIENQFTRWDSARIGEGLSDRVMSAGRPIATLDISADPQLAGPLLSRSGLKSVLSVPLIVWDELIGVVHVGTFSTHQFMPPEISRIQLLAERAALAIENALLFSKVEQQVAELRRTTNQLRHLQAIVQAMVSSLDPSRVMQVIAEGVVNELAYDAAVVTLYDEAEHSFTAAATYPEPGQSDSLEVRDGRPASFVFNPERHAGYRRLLLGETWVCHSFSDLVKPGVNRTVSDVLYVLFGQASIIVVPMWVQGKMLGAIFAGTQRQEINQEDREVLQIVAQQAAIAIDNARLFEETHRRSHEIGRLKEFNDNIIASMDEGILVFDETGHISFINRRIEEMLGYTRQDLLNSHWTMIVPVEDQERVAPEFTYKPFCPGNRFETNLLAKNGQSVPVMGSSVPLFEGDKLIGILSVFTDMTVRKQIERQLLQAEKLSAVGELVAGVAHELNNPLTTVIGYAQLMLESDLPARYRADITKINDQALRCAKIVAKLLTFAREHKPEKQSVNLNTILDETLALRMYQLRLDNIQVVRELDSQLPDVLADPVQMQQVFLNIILNAQQAMSAFQNGRLTVRSLAKDGFARVEIADNGPGIPPDIIGRIFDPFFTTKPVGKGTGLGLSICYGVIQEHDGRIWVESQVNKGATFIIELPLYSEPVVPEVTSTMVEEPKVWPQKILVVDDEHAVATLVQRLLERDGHTVEITHDGTSALKKLSRKRYDLIISDVRMPGLDGRHLFARLKQQDPELLKRVIFFTGDTANAETQAFLKESGSRFVTKPLRSEELMSVVREVAAKNAPGAKKGDPEPTSS